MDGERPRRSYWLAPSRTSRRPALRFLLPLAGFVFIPRLLHLRAAADDFLDIVSRHVSDMPRGGVVHSFDGSAEEGARILQHQQLAIGASFGYEQEYTGKQTSNFIRWTWLVLT